ncbi:MAG: glycosyl transferase GT4 family protein, partial [Methanobrevibacter sp.]|nr:glycosyl transferase GT4 family protein [Methanobrevibacter sp.]
IISSSWPVTCHTIAKDLKDKYDIPWIADLRDLWNLNPYVSHTFIRTYFEKRLELNTFENVDALTTTTYLAAKTLATLHPNNKIVPILSGYERCDFEFLDSIIDNNENYENYEDYDNNSQIEDSTKENKLKFIYAGSLYGGKRDPTNLFKAIRQLEDENKLDSSKIFIEFYGDDTNLEEIANRYGLRDILKIGGKISHEDVLKKQLGSDVLLLISWDNEKEKMFIPGKIYEYFALNRPVLSIGHKEGSLKDLIEETKVGYHVSDLESTKEALLNIYNEFIEKGKVELNSDINIEDYSMENMAKKFADLLNELDV